MREVGFEMSITQDEVHVLAADARLKITPAEMPEIIGYLNNFLAEMERMNELDLEGVPLFDFAEATSCPVREDVVIEYKDRNDILAAAPAREGDYYRVARILEE